MTQHPEPIQRLINAFKRFPGVGDRSAERYAYHVLNSPRDDARALAGAVRDVKTKIKKCKVCHNLTDSDTCPICLDSSRDNEIICVVEGHEAVSALERSSSYRGLYHVLWGHISPIEGTGPEDITARSLVARVKKGSVKEVIFALNPTHEGDGTTLYLIEQIKALNVKVTRPARGISSGSDLARANSTVLTDAIRGRSQI